MGHNGNYGGYGVSSVESTANSGEYQERVVVDVRNRFDGGWSKGFEIAERVSDDRNGQRFRVRRVSDGYLLPAVFAAEDLIARH